MSRLKCHRLSLLLLRLTDFLGYMCLHLLHAFRTISIHFNIFCFVLIFTSYDCFTLENVCGALHVIVLEIFLASLLP